MGAKISGFRSTGQGHQVQISGHAARRLESGLAHQVQISGGASNRRAGKSRAIEWMG
jgi:hypothetical protein